MRSSAPGHEPLDAPLRAAGLSAIADPLREGEAGGSPNTALEAESAAGRTSADSAVLGAVRLVVGSPAVYRPTARPSSAGNAEPFDGGCDPRAGV